MYIILALLIVICIASALLARRVALDKGIKPTPWMVAAILVGPLSPAALYIIPGRPGRR
jgi:ABC-type iron transport system FetAB permease component